MPIPLVLDVETTIHNDGHPFDTNNCLCVVGLYDGITPSTLDIEYSCEPFNQELGRINQELSSSPLLVGFNIKFDLHWLRRYGISFTNCPVWDCQLAQFILLNQETPYPSLDGVAEYYSLGSKLSNINDRYWSKGIDTREIPWEELKEYSEQDLKLTYKIYLKQMERVSEEQLKLIRLACKDLLVLEEMEWNGMKYDLLKSQSLGEGIKSRIAAIEQSLNSLLPSQVRGFFNWNSTDHLSALLYGGTIKEETKEPYEFQYKDGRVAIKEKWTTKLHTLPRIFTPLRGTSLKKEGLFSTNASTLQMLRGSSSNKKFLNLLLEREKLEKQRGTYYQGLVEKYKEMGWSDSLIHGNLNQCVARTGRLSSSNPNMQNLEDEVKQCFITRY